MNINVDYIVNKLVALLNTPSPSGNTKKAIEIVEKEFKSLGLITHRTNKGALIATIAGQNQDKEVTLSAHVDTLGAMVKR